jgi:hypothetical protein
MMKSYLFSLGDSSKGPIGFCARIRATSQAKALEILKRQLPESVDVDANGGDGDAVEYINVYFNDAAITVKAIEEVQEVR